MRETTWRYTGVNTWSAEIDGVRVDVYHGEFDRDWRMCFRGSIVDLRIDGASPEQAKLAAERTFARVTEVKARCQYIDAMRKRALETEDEA